MSFTKSNSQEDYYNKWLNQKINRLTPFEIDRTKISNGIVIPRLKCLCECGTVKYVSATHLVNGYIQSCGCAIKRYDVNENFFTTPNVVNSYWAGFIAADGCIITNGSNHRLNLRVKLALKDIIILEKLKHDIEYTGVVESYKEKSLGKLWDKVRLSICSHKICEDLIQNFNVTQRKTYTLQPPPNLNNDETLAYIAGYIDGDGSISITKENYPCIQVHGTKAIVTWISQIIKQTLNFAKIGGFNKRPNEKVHSYRFKGTNVIKFAQHIFSIKEIQSRLLERKWDKLRCYV